MIIRSIAVTLACLSLQAGLHAQETTEYGLPNLQGVWNFSAQTPLQRPERFGDREFLNEQELRAISQRRMDSARASAQREAGVAEAILSNTNATSTGAVNSFWMESTELDQNRRTSLIIHPGNGRIPPLRPGLEIQRSDANGVREIPGTRPVRYTHGGIGRDGPEDRGLSERCLVFNSGPPLLSGPYNNNIQIFQNRDHVVILSEMGFDARIVPLDGRPPIHGDITLWSGDSRGHFEGNSLVVESRNFTDKIASLGMRQEAYGDASERVLIERFTVIANNRMEYEFTISDPATFTDDLVVLMPMARVDATLYEYACHAGNYAMTNILRGARVEESR